MSDVVDYPAAHSMDTTWFAVDEEGFVAEFNTSEDGGIPGEAPPVDRRPETEQVETPSDPFYLAAVRVARAYAADPEHEAFDDDSSPTRAQRAVFALRAVPTESVAGYRTVPTSGAESLVPAGKLFVLREAAPRVLATTVALPPDQLVALHKHPDVAAFWLEQDLDEVIYAAEGRDGMFVYQHDYEAHTGAGAYTRGDAPAEPLRLADLPPPARAGLDPIKIPVKFREKEDLHLADYFSTGITWADSPWRDSPQARFEREKQTMESERAKLVERAESRKLGVIVTVVVLVFAVIACLLLPGRGHH